MKTLETRGGGGGRDLGFRLRSNFIKSTSLFTSFLILSLTNNIANAAGTPCSITPVMSETDLDSCIAEAPTDNSEFTITLGADFSITAQKSITDGKNITLISVDLANPATITRGSGFVGRLFGISTATPGGTTTFTVDSVIIDGGNPVAAADNQLIYSSGPGNATVNVVGNTILENNNSLSGGGAISLGGGSSELNITGNAQIINNVSGNDGGGIGIISNSNTLNIFGNVVIGGNTAGRGAGIYIAGVSAIATIGGGAKITNNTIATGNGAGLYLNSASGTLTISDAAISGNSTNYYGGGIYVLLGTLNLGSGAIVSGNTADLSGGGIYVRDAGTTIMSGGEISGNTANGNGGGVNIIGSTATFTMTGGTISGNTAANGGGVRADDSGTFIMAGGTINNNTATNGGGVYVGDGTLGGGAFGSGTFTLTGGNIVNNTAYADGGAIWVPHANLAYLTVGPSAVFSGNSAATYARMNPADQALYDAQISATSFSLPLPFNGYNNYDINYTSDLPTDICQHNSSLWADDANCVAAPGTGAEPFDLDNGAVSLVGFGCAVVIIVASVVFLRRKSIFML